MKFLLDNLFYVALAVVSGSMLLWPLIRGSAAGPAISPLDATMRINKQDAVVIDVRDAEQYAQGHLPRARHIPLAELAGRAGELERFKKKPVIVTCDGGVRDAPAALKVLRQHGFEQVFNLEGGIAAWRKADLPVEKTA